MSLSQVRAGRTWFEGAAVVASEAHFRWITGADAGAQPDDGSRPEGQETGDAVKQHAARMTRIAQLIDAIKGQQAEMQRLAGRMAELQERLNRELALPATAPSKRRSPKTAGTNGGSKIKRSRR
jgi:hypothetical protein